MLLRPTARGASVSEKLTGNGQAALLKEPALPQNGMSSSNSSLRDPAALPPPDSSA
jgi:hypothetical protein